MNESPNCSHFGIKFSKKLKIAGLWSCLTIIAATPSWAGNGNMLHGFGPVNSSMGGAGAGLWIDDPVGALMFNPSLMTLSEGNNVSFGTEFFWDDIEIKVKLNGGNGDRSGKTDPDRQAGVIPSIGFTHHAAGSNWAFGFGLIGIAGFRTDYSNDPDSILFDTPPNGFGRIYTDHRVTKIPLAVAYQITSKLSLGFSLNGYIAELAIAPLPYRVYDAVDGDDNLRFYPQGDGLVSRYAFSVQPSFTYQVSSDFTIGGSITTKQDFDPFEWNSTFANPNNPNFGQHRDLEFDLDGPLTATVGAGINLNDKTKVALDIMWIKYDGVSGFGSPGGITNRTVNPFGWDNVWVYKIGVQHELTDKITLRAGYNYSDIPMPDKNTLTATGAPAVFQHHITAGLGVKVNESLTANLGAYWVPRSSIKGVYEDLDNNPLGTIKTSNSLISVSAGLSWKF